ncbi:MAG: UDP-N-acetylmuramoyl-L-alanine--D-glutamate ligase [Desulfobacterales bacterium]|nr:UDP-N-acetylmuramoyl-L-alanine--D-glutamate ligase [Desulfobacterales bacterium]
MDIKNKNILIVGLGKTGIALAKFLHKRGAKVTATDISKIEDIGEQVKPLKDLGVKLEIGQHITESFINADIILISPGVPHLIPPIREAMNKGVTIMGEIEFAYRFINEPIIAITGTNGKTTVTTLIAEILKNAGKKVFLGGNIGNPLINYVDSGEKADVIIAEISSFQLDTISTFRPKVGVLLNITDDHLDRYKNFNEYVLSKGRIFENQLEDDYAILKGDDSNIRLISENIRSKKIFFSLESNYVSAKEFSFERIRIEMEPDIDCVIRLKNRKIIGIHNIENMIAASMATLCLGIGVGYISKTLNDFKGLSHRIEYVDTVKGIQYYDDSKGTNIDAVYKAVDAFESKVVIIMGGIYKGGEFDSLKEIIGKKVKAIVAIGEAKDKIKSSLSSYVQVEIAKTMDEAVNTATTLAEHNGVVLLSPGCSSFDMFKSYVHRGEIFCKAVKKIKDAE